MKKSVYLTVSRDELTDPGVRTIKTYADKDRKVLLSLTRVRKPRS